MLACKKAKAQADATVARMQRDIPPPQHQQHQILFEGPVWSRGQKHQQCQILFEGPLRSRDCARERRQWQGVAVSSALLRTLSRLAAAAPPRTPFPLDYYPVHPKTSRLYSPDQPFFPPRAQSAGDGFLQATWARKTKTCTAGTSPDPTHSNQQHSNAG